MAPEALWELGADVISIGVEPDGFNINKECGSTAPEALRRKVREMRADIGIALDGDADRVVIVDERGHLVDGDQLLAVIARKLERGRPAGQARRRRHRDVESRPRTLSRSARASSWCARRSATATCSSRCASTATIVGGEPSGHIILSDYTTTGDGFVAGAAGAGGGAAAGQPVSEVCHRFDPLPQVLKNVRYRSGKPLDDADVKSAIDAGEKRLNGHGRLLVRSSGTEPVIRVMGEGDDRILVEEVVDHIVTALGEAAAAA